MTLVAKATQSLSRFNLDFSGAGFSQFANTKGIYVLRNENGKQKRYPVNYKKLVKGEAPEQNIFLKPGDTIVIP